MKSRVGKLLMVGLLSCMLVGCGNSTLTTADEAVSVSGKVSAAKTVEVVQREEGSTELEAVERYLEANAAVFACYDIQIADEDGNAVQPEGVVEVKIRLTDELVNASGDTYTVFYVNGENFTKLDCSEADGYVTFKTDHFSVYVVAKYEADKSAIAELVNGTEMEIPHIHKYEVDEATALAPTCTEIGKEADEICSCGDKIVGAEIASLGHNYEEVADSVIPATCDTDGKEADTKCSLCENVVEGAVIPASGHSYGEYIYNNDATTSADGTETATCSVCGGTDTRTKAGTKIEIVYDGYDEFGNGYVMGDDGYKHFDCACPYPLFQVEDGGSWVSGYSVYGVRGVSSECKRILDHRYPDTAHNKVNNRAERYAMGYYKEGLVFYEKWVH